MEIPGNEFSKKYLGEDLFEDGSVMHNISLLLTNAHFSLNRPRPLVPGDVEVGGIHVGTPKPLPSVCNRYISLIFLRLKIRVPMLFFYISNRIWKNGLMSQKMGLFSSAWGP